MIKAEFRGYKKTVIVFSGLAPKNHIFEWFGSFSKLPCNIISVRDPNNCWYQKDYLEILNSLNFVLNGIDKKDLVCVGGSAGGFAALWFGNKLGVEKILAFCPQSACGEAKRDLGDDRWMNFCMETPSFDLKGDYPQAIVYYAKDDKFDVIHAERLNKAEFRVWETGGHKLPIIMKEDGNLQDILMELL